MKLVSFTKYKKSVDFEFLVNEIYVYVSKENDEISISPKDGYISIDAYNDILEFIKKEEAVITWD
jgi:hypothetical protein